MQKEVSLQRNKLLITACKRHNTASGATQGYERLHAKRYGQVYEMKKIIYQL
jgi:hypothetical protein